MAMKTKVRKIGNSLGVVLPREAIEAMHVEEGAALYITRGPNDSIQLSPEKEGFEEKMKVAEDLMNRYRDAFRELAK